MIEQILIPYKQNCSLQLIFLIKHVNDTLRIAILVERACFYTSIAFNICKEMVFPKKLNLLALKDNKINRFNTIGHLSSFGTGKEYHFSSLNNLSHKFKIRMYHSKEGF